MVMGKSKRTKYTKMYNLNYLIENLGEDDDLDTLLNNW
jgi:hypothetical protein